MSAFRIETDRLVLRPWRHSDGDDFAEMNAVGEVRAELGGPLSREGSDAKLERFTRSFDVDGLTRWVVTERGVFLGYCGIVAHREPHPLDTHHDIGWRLTRSAWGRGIATEAARAVLTDAFGRMGLDEVLAYTAADNTRSQAVMERLELERRADLDFTQHFDDVGEWRGLVWAANRKGVSRRAVNGR